MMRNKTFKSLARQLARGDESAFQKMAKALRTATQQGTAAAGADAAGGS
jgi:hypothetical protein